MLHAQANSGRYHSNYIQCKKIAIPKSLRWIDFVCCSSSIWCVSRCWFVTSKRLLPHLILLSCRLVTRIGFNQTRHSQPYKLRPSKLNQYHLIYSFQACEVEKALKRTKYLSCVFIIVFKNEIATVNQFAIRIRLTWLFMFYVLQIYYKACINCIQRSFETSSNLWIKLIDYFIIILWNFH